MGRAIKRAADFVNSIGVSAHLEQTTNSNGNVALVERDMLYLGLHKMRVVTPGLNAAAYVSLGQLGIRFDIILNNTALGYYPDTGFADQLKLLDSIAPYISSVEGPNEVDLLPVPYKGLTGPAAVMALQQDLYAAVKSDPLLHAVSVLPFSLSYFADVTAYGDMSPYADYANIHDYSAWGDAPYLSFSRILGNTTAPSRPIFVTETGYSTSNSVSGVDEGVQAKYIIDVLFNAYRDGVANTFIYQLMDPLIDPVGTDPELHWGLFNADGTPKLAATAIHNLTHILSDAGPTASTFTTGSLDYTLTGLPAASFDTLLQKSNGSFDIELWQEPALWNRTTRTENIIAPTSVQLSFHGVMFLVQVFDPIVGTNPIASYGYVTSLSIALGSDPLIIEVTPVGTPAVLAVVPASPVINGISYGTDTGVSATDGVTANTSPTLLGTGTVGATVTVRDGATPIGSAVVNNAGIWALSTATLPQGSHVFTAVASAAVGSSPASARYTVVIDTIAPAITAITASAPAGTILRPSQTVSFALALSKPILLDTGQGSPTLALSSGVSATLDAGRSTATALVFSTTVLSGQTDPNLAATTLALNGAVITDQAGNTLSALDLSRLPGSSSGISIDATPLPVTLGAGPDTIVLGVSEVGWYEDARFGIKVDGVQIGGTQTATAIHGTGSQIYTLNGDFGQGSHKVSVTLFNAGWDPHSRQLFIDTISAGGRTASFSAGISNTSASLVYDSPIIWRPSAPVSLGAGPDSITVNLSENAWKGDAQATISVDGVQIGGVQTITAEHAAGQSQAFTLHGSFGPGTHAVAVQQTNWNTGGTPLLNRTVTIDSVTASGTTTALGTTLVPGVATTVYATLPVLAALPALSVGNGPDTIKVGVSEDAFQGDAQFVFSVDGVQVGGAQTTQAQHGAKQSQVFALNGNFGQGSHSVAVTLLNWAWDWTHVRRLYVDTVAGTSASTGVAGSLSAAGTSLVYDSPIIWRPAAPVSLGAGPDSITVNLSENAWKGDAQATISVDGVQIGGIQTITAEHDAGQSQAFTLHGSFGPGTHHVAVSQLNWDTGGTTLLDRTVTIDSITASGVTSPINVKLVSNLTMTLAVALAPAVAAANNHAPSTLVGSGSGGGNTQPDDVKAHGNAPAPASMPADPLVDAGYYYARNSDVVRAGLDASTHYMSTGWKAGLNPNAFFDSNYYLAQNPDVKASGMNPLLHFETFGWKEGRQPSLAFDDAKYLAAYPDVKAAGVNPLWHYVVSGMAEGRTAFSV